MIDTRNTEKLVAAAGAVLTGERRTSAKAERARHSEIFSIFGMYRDPRSQPAGA
ncbi:MAG: hypothetical protein V2I27_10615 [Erythrobacter sp.]|jgi:hypothetical protein|nr:hypothetical protein [Erythrobacter sp.]